MSPRTKYEASDASSNKNSVANMTVYRPANYNDNTEEIPISRQKKPLRYRIKKSEASQNMDSNEHLLLNTRVSKIHYKHEHTS